MDSNGTTPGSSSDGSRTERHIVPTDRPKRLYRSSDRRILLGVCGGLADYFDVDATLVRLVFLALAFFGGSGILIYILMAIVMPSEEHLEAHPRDAAKSTIDEAVTGARSAVNSASGWVRQKTGRS